jgi:hypothetical protein
MMSKRRLVPLVAAMLAITAGGIGATPSTTYWTPMTPDIQPYGVLHVGVDDYFTVFREADDGAGDFPTDIGLTLGLLPFEKVRAEIGIDLLEPADAPLYFNAKIGLPEGALFPSAPTLQIGVFNVGTESGVTNQNVVYGVIGKSLRGIGRLSAGPYAGNRKLLADRNGRKESSGFMVAFDRGFLPSGGVAGAYNRVVFAADYASGENAVGGGGFGLYYFFTADISLLTGPVWFNAETINGPWKWTVQVDINRTIFAR